MVKCNFIVGKKKNGGGIIAYGSGGETSDDTESAEEVLTDSSELSICQNTIVYCGRKTDCKVV